MLSEADLWWVAAERAVQSEEIVLGLRLSKER